MRLNPGMPDLYLDRDYADSLYAAGGTPLHLPLIPDIQFLETATAGVSGICLPGSNSDVAPVLYGETPEAGLGPVQPLRDKTDWLLLDLAFRRRLPLFCICYGVQVLNVYRGGTLYQNLPAAGPAEVNHRAPDHGRWNSHEAITADPAPAFFEHARGRFPVNSSHHQAIRKPGQGLLPFVRAADGVVEGVYLDDPAHFVIGTQWHPEAIRLESPESSMLFDLFLAACRASGTG